MPDREGSGLLLTIVPLKDGCAAGSSLPSVAVFIQDPRLMPACPGEAFGALYGLTAGELRVAMALTSGLTVQEVAAGLGISTTTLKTHLAHIFQKTGTSRQADLRALISRASGPLRLPMGLSPQAA